MSVDTYMEPEKCTLRLNKPKAFYPGCRARWGDRQLSRTSHHVTSRSVVSNMRFMAEEMQVIVTPNALSRTIRCRMESPLMKLSG